MKELTDISTEELREELKTRGIIPVVCSKDDILATIDGMNETEYPHPSDVKYPKDIRFVGLVVEYLTHYHDANVGINWEVIQDAVYECSKEQ